MTEFATTASLEIAVDQSSLSAARSTIESEFEDISVGVSADSGMTASSLGDAGTPAATDGGQSVTDLLTEQLDVLEDIESAIDSGVGAGRDRTAIFPLGGLGALGPLLAGGLAGGALSPGLFGRGGVIEDPGEGVGIMQPIAEFFDDLGRDIGLPDLSEVTFDDFRAGVDRLHDWSADVFDETVNTLHEWTAAPFEIVVDQLHDWTPEVFVGNVDRLRDWTAETFGTDVDRLHDWTVETFTGGVDRLHNWTVEPFETAVETLDAWPPVTFTDAVDALLGWEPPTAADLLGVDSDLFETPSVREGATDTFDQLTAGDDSNRAEGRRPARTDVSITNDVTIDPAGLREIERRLDDVPRMIRREVQRVIRG